MAAGITWLSSVFQDDYFDHWHIKGLGVLMDFGSVYSI